MLILDNYCAISLQLGATYTFAEYHIRRMIDILGETVGWGGDDAFYDAHAKNTTIDLYKIKAMDCPVKMYDSSKTL